MAGSRTTLPVRGIHGPAQPTGTHRTDDRCPTHPGGDHDTRSPDDSKLLTGADHALYEAKAAGLRVHTDPAGGYEGDTPVATEKESTMARNTLSRSLHDVGLSAWFGGTLANAVSLNRTAAAAGEQQRATEMHKGLLGRLTPA